MVQTGLYEKTIDAVHDMRVSCRRLQAVLVLFEDSIKKNLFKKFNKNLRALIRRLGKARQFECGHGNHRPAHTCP